MLNFLRSKMNWFDIRLLGNTQKLSKVSLFGLHQFQLAEPTNKLRV